MEQKHNTVSITNSGVTVNNFFYPWFTAVIFLVLFWTDCSFVCGKRIFNFAKCNPLARTSSYFSLKPRERGKHYISTHTHTQHTHRGGNSTQWMCMGAWISWVSHTQVYNHKLTNIYTYWETHCHTHTHTHTHDSHHETCQDTGVYWINPFPHSQTSESVPRRLSHEWPRLCFTVFLPDLNLWSLSHV